jgi:hypothetical protein
MRKDWLSDQNISKILFEIQIESFENKIRIKTIEDLLKRNEKIFIKVKPN